MTLSPLDTTTTPAEAHARQMQALRDRCTQLEAAQSGIGTIIAATYEAAVAQLPKPGVDGAMILGRGGFHPTLFIFDGTGESEGSWYAIKASEV
jgi:hypothetical protein